MTQWQPTASIDTLHKRAALLRDIREFFFQRKVTEVDTPALMAHTVSDPYMSALSVTMGRKAFYLQTSPEYAMKRLLAAGMGDIYQLAKNYRADEVGRKHQPEFTMLEWYRLGWDHHQLMDEVYDLVSQLSSIKNKEAFSYQQVFQSKLNIDPLTISEQALREIAIDAFGPLPNDLFRDDYLTLLFAEKIEPQLGSNSICFVYDFPSSQSALARILPDNPHCAGRFEVYVQGTELANGFWELTDAQEQKIRFEEDNKKRLQMGKETVETDEAFLHALESGLPECSGVALGVDRLFMIASSKSTIDEVTYFPLRPFNP